MPLRRRPARVPQHRRARSRGRPVRGGPLRGRGHPRRSRAPTAITASARGGRISGRRSRTTPSSSAAGTSPSTAARSCGCVMRDAREIEVIDDGDIARWTAEHDGYASLDPPAVAPPFGAAGPGVAQHRHHRRDRRRPPRPPPRLPLRSRGSGGAQGSGAVLGWPAASTPGAARLELPPGLRWSLHRGETDPILGWYSPGLGRRVPAFSLLGRGRCVPGAPLATRLEFVEAGSSRESRPFPDGPYHWVHP